MSILLKIAKCVRIQPDMVEGQNGLFDGQYSDIYNMLRRKPPTGTSYDTETFVREYCATHGGGKEQALVRKDFVENRMAGGVELEVVCNSAQADAQISRDPENLDKVPYYGEIVAVVGKIPKHTVAA